jgi:ABC-type uncharacterized transport system substrate-binding protein
MTFCIGRREFITLLGGAAAACPLRAGAQQPLKLPTIGVLGAGTPSGWAHWVAAFVQRLRELGWVEGRTVAMEVRWAEGRPERYTEIAAEFVRLRVDVIVTVGSAVVAINAYQNRINILAVGARLPTIYPSRNFLESGGLISYGVNNADLFRRAADYTDKILRGAKPSDLPVEQPTKFELVFNLTAAKALGLEIPPTLLARADEVIE